MKGKRELAIIAAAVTLFVGAFVFMEKVSVDELKTIAAENRIEGAALFALVMFSTTVIAPLASLPMVPILAPILGPFTVATASLIGWALGAFVAFFIGRRYGRPVVSRFVNMEKLERYERYVKPETEFMLIVLLRMLIPVDILSYALAILSTVSFRTYAMATVLGISWFSYAFAYMGQAIAERDYILLGELGVASVLILSFSWYYVRRMTSKVEK